MSLTAQVLIDGAFDLCNVKAVGESLDTADYTDALRRLNNFVRLLNNQSLVSSFTAREVFQLLSGQSTYTIGPGGDFDTSRPFQLENVSVLQNATIGTYAVTDSDPVAGTFTVAGDQTGVFVSGSDCVVSGSTANDGSYTIVSSVFGAATVISVVESVTDDSGDGDITVFTEVASTTIEIPRALITDDMYAGLQIKALQNLFPSFVYFNANYSRGMASIYVWPEPNASTYGLVIYRRNVLAEFADLDTAYDVPPGFEEVLEYGLAERLLTPYAVSDPMIRSDVQKGGVNALMIVKRQNTRIMDVQLDPGLTSDKRGRFNINTGQGGGS